MINTLQAFFSHLVRLVESGLGTKTPRQGEKQVTCHITIMVIVVMMVVTQTGDYTNNNDDY